MRWKVLLVSIILGSAPLGFAQSSNKPATISLGGDLTLGLPRGQVLSMLQRTYDLQKTEDKDETYLVEDKASKSNRVVGVVTFTAGKLSYASREWARDVNNDASALADSLFGLLGTLDMKLCIVSTYSQRNPDTEFQVVHWKCGDKGISLIRTRNVAGQYKGQISVALSEELHPLSK